MLTDFILLLISSALFVKSPYFFSLERNCKVELIISARYIGSQTNKKITWILKDFVRKDLVSQKGISVLRNR